MLATRLGSCSCVRLSGARLLSSIGDRLFEPHDVASLHQDARPAEDAFPPFSRIIISPSFTVAVYGTVRRVLELRERYQAANHTLTVPASEAPSIASLASSADKYRVEFRGGRFVASGTPGLESAMAAIPAAPEFIEDIVSLWQACKDPAVNEVCNRRLEILDINHKFHRLQNGHSEYRASKTAGADFWSVVKVDNHIHATSMASVAHIMDYMQRACEEHGDDVVLHVNGHDVTLNRLLVEKGISPSALSVGDLDMRLRDHMYGRFDSFNRALSPLEDDALRAVFLKTDNEAGGKFFANIVREVSEQTSTALNLGRAGRGEPLIRDPPHVAFEPRVSVYGKAKGEWAAVAQWWKRNKLRDLDASRFWVQFPRLFPRYLADGTVADFGEFLRNLFEPLFEVSVDPSKDPDLHEFLLNLGAIDTVDDESQWDVLTFDPTARPEDTNVTNNHAPVTYSQYCYWFFANIASLNALRVQRGLNSIPFKPHCGESGAAHHLATGFLVADGIQHGINLRHNAVIQYLYFLSQLPISMSPLSNNALFLKLPRNPFPQLFARGLRVSLSTDDPNILHYSNSALLEEYSVAAAAYDLSQQDLTEIACNSVRMSTFPDAMKRVWLGEDYALPGTAGNDIHKTAVTNMRVLHRDNQLRRELHLMARATEAAYTQPEGAFRLADPLCDGSWRSDDVAIQALVDLHQGAVAYEPHPS